MQCESDLTFQRGQVQQSYIGTVCLQLQQQMATYLMAAVWEGGEPASRVHPAAVDLVTSLVEVQADLVRLAPPACLIQVRPAPTHPLVCAMLLQLLLYCHAATVCLLLLITRSSLGANFTSTCTQCSRHMSLPVQA